MTDRRRLWAVTPSVKPVGGVVKVFDYVLHALDLGWAAATGHHGIRLERRATVAPVPRCPAGRAQIDTVMAAANLVNDFDDTVAEEIFGVNVDLDEPRDERRERFARWRAEKQLDRPFAEADLEMVSPLRGVVTVPGTAEAKSTITVGLNHLGEVQAITLSS